jgi:hypothetical protein
MFATRPWTCAPGSSGEQRPHEQPASRSNGPGVLHESIATLSDKDDRLAETVERLQANELMPRVKSVDLLREAPSVSSSLARSILMWARGCRPRWIDAVEAG